MTLCKKTRKEGLRQGARGGVREQARERRGERGADHRDGVVHRDEWIIALARERDDPLGGVVRRNVPVLCLNARDQCREQSKEARSNIRPHPLDNNVFSFPSSLFSGFKIVFAD